MQKLFCVSQALLQHWPDVEHVVKSETHVDGVSQMPLGLQYEEQHSPAAKQLEPLPLHEVPASARQMPLPHALLQQSLFVVHVPVLFGMQPGVPESATVHVPFTHVSLLLQKSQELPVWPHA